jgi:osmoprotectant transport system substrate-binding protein
VRTARSIAVVSISLAFVVGACTTSVSSPSAASSSPPPAIRIGAADSVESQIVAELYAQVLEGSGYPVVRDFGLGEADAVTRALVAGAIDLAPQYLGSTLAFFDPTKPSGDPAKDAAALAEILKGRAGGISVLDYSPGEDTYALAVRRATADRLGLKTISDLARVASQLTWGLPADCATDPACGPALENAYGIDIGALTVQPFARCDAPIAAALAAGTIDVAELCSTQAEIAQSGFVLLADDRQVEPAENIAPVIRDGALAAAGRADVTALLDLVSTELTTSELASLDAQVTVDHGAIPDVAKAWLTDNGLLQ